MGRLFFLVLALAAACGGDTAKQAGERCVASSECGPGLVCDLGQTPPVCAGSVTVDAAEVDADPTDAATDAPDDAPTDAAVIDAAVDAPIDAAVDAPIDAPIDAPTDAPIDAAIDAPPV